MPVSRTFSLKNPQQSFSFSTEDCGTECIERPRRQREIRITRPKGGSFEARNDPRELRERIQAAVAVRDHALLHRQSFPEHPQTRSRIATIVLETSVVHAPESWVCRSHQQKMRSGFHRAEQFRDEQKIIFDVLENIGKEHDVRFCHEIYAIFRGISLMKFGSWEAFPRKLHRLRNRLNADAAIFAREFRSVAACSASDIEQ